METGRIAVSKVGGKSTVTGCFSRYPLKFIVPRKVGSSEVDAVWVYGLTYGGGIVSGDTISCKFEVGDGCTLVLTTQASTKVYKSLGMKCSQQFLEAEIGSGSVFVLIPDPVTCFSTARYFQKQVFRVAPDSNLVVVDWITSGRHERGEKWDFQLYKSMNNIVAGDDLPLFLDTILLEPGEDVSPLAERMRDYQVIAMVIFLGPKLTCIQGHVQENVRRMMSEQLQGYHSAFGGQTRSKAQYAASKPPFVASCSSFGPKGLGTVVRVASTTTESVYTFLRHQLAGLEALIGVSPYHI
ncbi:hypothetical protein MLD38_019906 [Melastoma candidum]|uniref:Uncharacterized protein n=1 Tax=Melastoma candidum TaxID=119954 RepID=A0ACB9QBT2_9MYRT|nr:hypothetical protein MLD38_019906 [Melastoma candidum]